MTDERWEYDGLCRRLKIYVETRGIETWDVLNQGCIKHCLKYNSGIDEECEGYEKEGR